MKRRGFVGSLIAALTAGPAAWRTVAEAQEAKPRLQEIFSDEVQLERQPIAVVQGGYFVRLEAKEPLKIGQLVKVGDDGRIVHTELPADNVVGIVIAHDIQPNMEVVQVYGQVL